jgi:hypothetical protein
MENQVSVKRSVNYAFKIVGYLGHDNKLFDRTCPACRKGMYSSREYSRCPKCGAALGYLTSGDGKAIAISEGTLYPAFGPKQEKRDADEVSKRKNGMAPVYRFKMFNFIDDHGVLIPPPEHDGCRKGAKVEILTMGHQLVPSWFMGKNPDGSKSAKVELLIMVYTNYGDYVKVLTDQEYASKTVSHKVYPDGSPAPIEMPVTGLAADIAALEKKIADIKAAQLPQAPISQPEPFSDAGAPWEERKAVSVADNDVDPFAYAS